MGIVVAFSRNGNTTAECSDRVGRVAMQPGLDVRDIMWLLPNAAVALRTGPEVFLAYENDDTRAGTRGKAVVLGYLVYGRPRSSLAELGQSLLEAWTKQGTKFLSQTEGSFSVFLYNAAEDRCLFATDPLSSRPFWYADLAGEAILTSELHYMPRLLRTAPALDKAYLWSFFHRDSTVGDRSPFDAVRGVQPGQALEFRAGAFERKSYYTEPIFRPDFNRSPRQTAEELVHGMRETVDELCVGSRSPCLFLSGGLDSRLIAGISPDSVTAVTLCDSVNQEVRIAKKIAHRCGLKHTIIQRDGDWYPSLAEEASVLGGGLWSWVQAHYLPLAGLPQTFPHDAATLGFGCDTYFKGLSLSKLRGIAQRTKNNQWQGPDLRKFRDIVLRENGGTSERSSVFARRLCEQCREAYGEAVESELAACENWSTCMADLWELFLSRSLMRVPEMLNLVSLRSFVSERNLFSSPRLRRLYLTLPSDVRATGDLVSQALTIVGKRLDWLPNSTTWLPPRFPRWTHAAALACRSQIAGVRGIVMRVARSRSIAGHCGWTRFDRLLDTNDRLRRMVGELIADEKAFPSEIFDRNAIGKLWTAQSWEADNRTALMNRLITFGLAHRSLIGQS